MVTSVAVCGHRMQKSEYVDSLQTVSIAGVDVRVGRVLEPRPAFDTSGPGHEHDVAVRVRGFSCNYRDLSLIRYLGLTLWDSSYCFVGSDFVADVIQVGCAVRQFGVGDRVIGDCNYPRRLQTDVPGGILTQHASRRYHVFHESQLLRLVDTVTDEVAAGFSVGAQTAYAIRRRLNIRSGSNILITACRSNTSLMIAHALRHLDVHITGVSTTAQLDDGFRSLGYSRMIKIREASDLQDCKELAKVAASIGGFDVIIDPFSDLFLPSLVRYLSVGAAYATCGVSLNGDGGPRSQLSQTMVQAVLKNVTLIANCLGRTSDLQDALEEYSAGGLGFMVDSVYRGGEVGGFFRRTFADGDRLGKVVYLYDQN